MAFGNGNLLGRLKFFHVIVFDKEGNIVSIQIMRWSQSDEVQDLFEQTLKEIRSLPNPPKALLENNEEFNIYYNLKIN